MLGRFPFTRPWKKKKGKKKRIRVLEVRCSIWQSTKIWNISHLLLAFLNINLWFTNISKFKKQHYQKVTSISRILKIRKNWGTRVAQVVKRLTLGFSSSHDLMVPEFKPHIRLHTGSADPALDSLSLSLPHSRSLSKYKYFFLKKNDVLKKRLEKTKLNFWRYVKTVRLLQSNKSCSFKQKL